MTNLPFVVQPRLQPITERIGTEDSGVIEVERRGFLSVSEKAFLQQSLNEDTVTSLLLQLIRKAAQELKISPDKAHAYTMDALSSKENKDALYNKFLKKYEEELYEITKSAMQMETKKQFIRALCIIINRVNPQFDMEGLGEVHPDLIEGLAKLCEEEENKSLDRLLASQAASEFATSATSEVEALEKK